MGRERPVLTWVAPEFKRLLKSKAALENKSIIDYTKDLSNKFDDKIPQRKSILDEITPLPNFAKKRKGQVFVNAVVVPVLLVVVVISLIFIYNISTKVNDSIQSDTSLGSDAKAISQHTVDVYPSTWDNAFMIVLFGLWLTMIVTSLFIDTHPILIGIIIFILIFVLVAPIFVSNAYSAVIGSNNEIWQDAQNFPKMNFVMTHLLEIIIIMSISEILALFVRIRQQ